MNFRFSNSLNDAVGSDLNIVLSAMSQASLTTNGISFENSIENLGKNEHQA